MSSAATLEPGGPSGAPPAGGGRDAPQTGWLQRVLRTFFSPSVGTVAGAIAAALVIGALIVTFFNADVDATLGYFFARPSDFFSAAGTAFGGFFSSLVRGAVYDWTQPTFASGIRPLTESVTRAIPLIVAGLAIAVSFTAGLFNIGVQGQLIMGALVAGYIGFGLHLPPVAHLLVAILGAILGGAVWGAIPGFLKARLGANEVIVTIMLNSVALYFLQHQLTTQRFIGSGGYAGKSQTVDSSAQYPLLLGSGFRLHWGFVAMLAAVALTWWLLERSTLGFELRAAGANPTAANTAGIDVPRTLFLTLTVSGALAGLAGTAPVLGTEHVLTNGVAGSLGFDAITVALLGRSRPLGTVLAGLLFGALNAGGSLMQSSAGIPVDIVQVTQAIIVLLIAASEAVRYRRAQRRAARRTARTVVAPADQAHQPQEGAQA